jgi:hypothetical protein
MAGCGLDDRGSIKKKKKNYFLCQLFDFGVKDKLVLCSKESRETFSWVNASGR